MTPDEFTIQEHFLDVGDGHQLYVQEWGKKDAEKAILFLHGGPGSATKDKHKGVFNPKKQRVIFFDQRGAGKSLPYGSLEHNTTQHLIEDINKVIGYLGITKFIITGGSWGSCLALAYSLAHPKKVIGLVLNGIFTASKTEIEWLDTGRFTPFFPDVWEKFLKDIPATHHKDPTSYIYDKLMSEDAGTARLAGYMYENMEAGAISLDDRFIPDKLEDYDPAGIRLEMFYMKNRCFMPDRHILDNAHKLTMPVWLIQGRYDMVCPPSTAYELSKKLPNAELIWTISGHRTERESWNVIRTILSHLTVRT